jgi:sigma-B regulation protein RsbU (phosphoserine phosphatase)
MAESDFSMTNESFDFLKKSSDFMDQILDNIPSCVLMLDKDMRLQAYNNPLKTIFSARKDDDILYIRCGEAIGCAYQIEEQTQCGKTSKCRDCELRVAGLTSYINDETIYKTDIVRPFMNDNGKKEVKHLEFSTRIFRHNKEKYIMLMVDDVSRFKVEQDLSGE